MAGSLLCFSLSPSPAPRRGFAERKRARAHGHSSPRVSRASYTKVPLLSYRGKWKGYVYRTTTNPPFEAQRPSHRLASPPNNKYPMIDFNWALAILPPPSPSSPRSPNFSHLSYHAKRENFLSSYARFFIPSPSIYIPHYIHETSFLIVLMIHLDLSLLFLPNFIDLFVAKKTRVRKISPLSFSVCSFFGRWMTVIINRKPGHLVGPRSLIFEKSRWFSRVLERWQSSSSNVFRPKKSGA